MILKLRILGSSLLLGLVALAGLFWHSLPARATIDLPPVPLQKPSSTAGIFKIALPSFKPARLGKKAPPIKSSQKAGKIEMSGFSVPFVPGSKPAHMAPDAPAMIGDTAEALLSFGVPRAPKAKPARNGDLSDQDTLHYKRIFRYQAAGDMKKADIEFNKLQDFRLRGHVLFQRYMHPTAYKSDFYELRNWLDLYADHPDAGQVYKLALSRMPPDYKEGLKKPETVRGIARVPEPTISEGKKYRIARKRNSAQEQKIRALKNLVNANIAKGVPSQAQKYLETAPAARLLDDVERDQLYTKIARGFFHAGKMDEAYDAATKAAAHSGIRVPLSGWIAGLIDWQRGNYKRAAQYFEMTGRSPYSSGWAAAGGAYWAARAHMRQGNVRAGNVWLKRAMEHPRTFYGLIAARALGKKPEFNWEVPPFTDRHLEVFAATPEGARALALEKVGMKHLAEKELIRMNPAPESELREAILAFADHAGLASLAMRLGNATPAPDGEFYDAALYPLSPWEPENGYRVEPSLINAIMRQESRFDPTAESPSGAAGLMQIMPGTASYVSGKKQYRSEAGKHKLLDPETNLDIGQDYLQDLLKHKNVSGDMISLLVAYNAGPGNLSKWKDSLRTDDDLLFIETIPVAETRGYVERVLSNYWIYRLRAGHNTPTLDALAAGRAANYALVDEKSNGDYYRLAQKTAPSSQIYGMRSKGLNR